MAEIDKNNVIEGKNYLSFSSQIQYIKDLSFENPNSPYSFVSGQQPKIDLSIKVNVSKIENSSYEVVLHINAQAKDDKDTVIFIAELQYAGLFDIPNIDEENIEDDEAARQTLFVECPSFLLPFARHIIMNITSYGGYPPMMISPINFAEMNKNLSIKKS